MSRQFTLTVETKAKVAKVLPRIPVEKWGKDHWSTFAYIETCCVDTRGKVSFPRMRCDEDRHPQFDANSQILGNNRKKYPTLYKGGQLADHDDWDCVDDMELVGLLKNIGTGINPMFKLTALGRLVAAQLRQHKMDGGNFGDFTPRI